MRIACPTCGKHDDVPDDFGWRPFCSRRCKMVDLGNWLGEVYRFSRPLSEDAAQPPGHEGHETLLSQLMLDTAD